MAYWGNDPTWLNLTGPQRAAAMALLEAEVGSGGINVNDARNALGAIINRAQEENQPLEEHVSRRIYQPIIEDNQRSRLEKIINSPEFNDLTNLAEQRISGEVPDWVGGADHYLAPPNTMLDLYNKDPDKYHNWGPFKNSRGVPGKNWTGFNPETGQYENFVLADDSHHFLNLYNNTSKVNSLPTEVAQAGTTPTTNTNQGNEPMLGALLGKIFGMGGPAATGTASVGHVTPLGTFGAPAGGAPSGGGTGMLSSLFPTDSGGGQPTGKEGMALAQDAMRRVSSQNPNSNMLQRKPVDISGLQALLARKPMLGYGPGRPV